LLGVPAVRPRRDRGVHLDVMDRAVEWGQRALGLDAGNQRLKSNLDFFIRRRDEIYAAT
jgi:hypothetical protein